MSTEAVIAELLASKEPLRILVYPPAYRGS